MDIPWLVLLVVSVIVALIVVSILNAGMKNVHTGSEAQHYVSSPLLLTSRHDQYTHTTTTRRKVEKK